MAARRLKNPRRYRRATLTAGRLEVFLAIAVVVVLLTVLATVVLPSPLSRVVVGVVIAGGAFLAFFDNEHEDRVGR
jgi:hypothetical protein